MNAKSLGDFKENFDSGGAFTAFDSANVIGVNVGFLRKGFLGQSRPFAIPENCFANYFAFRFTHLGYGNKSGQKAPHTPSVGRSFIVLVFEVKGEHYPRGDSVGGFSDGYL